MAVRPRPGSDGDRAPNRAQRRRTERGDASTGTGAPPRLDGGTAARRHQAPVQRRRTGTRGGR